MKITVIKYSGKNSEFVVIYNYSAWPVGTLKSRGWLNAPTLYVRDATPEEVQEWQETKRMIACRYMTWEDLVEDEALYRVDANQLRNKRIKIQVVEKV